MPRKPNILLIMTDQHRADFMSCVTTNGVSQTPVPTPGIDRIAQRGIRFENAYCPYPVCLASRSAMLTGLYPHTSGAVNNDDLLDRRYRTLAHHFNDAGYYTALIGKMHFNNACNHGFEYYLSINDWLMYLGPKAGAYADEIANHQLVTRFFDTVNDDGAGFPDVSGLWENNTSPWSGHVNRMPIGQPISQLSEEDQLDSFIMRESEKFLTQHGNQPFLLVASFMKPHTPFYPPKRFSERYPVSAMVLQDPGDISMYTPFIQDRSQQFSEIPAINRKSAKAGYLGNLAFVDECVGHLYEALERLGLLENTIVVYTSDHGEMNGDHGLYQKFCLFEPSVKVPLIISQPGTLPEGVVSPRLINQIGLYPTLAELAGTPPVNAAPLADMPNPPEKLDGVSFAEAVRHPGHTDDGEVFVEYNIAAKGKGQYMVRSGSYKYVYYETGEQELYDLSNDPGEIKNLIRHDDYTEIVAGLRARLTHYVPNRL